MTRNTQRRVEVACPVLDLDIRKQIKRDVEIYCSDTVKAREMGPDGTYAPIDRPGAPKVDCQAAFMEAALREGRLAAAGGNHHTGGKDGFFRSLLARLRR